MTAAPTPPIPTFEPVYVADTNALYWYLTGDKKLTPAAKAIFEAAKEGQTRLCVSVISLAELYWILQKKPLAQTFAQIYRDLKTTPYFEFISLEPDQVLDFAQDMAIPEMHDRIIVGLARRLKAPLITSDKLIRATNLLRTI